MAGLHAGMGRPVDIGEIKVAKATGPDAHTVAEILTKQSELKDKAVVVRGKVVKFTPAVLEKNWIHLRDGSGSAANGTNDLVVTTKDETRIGDVVLVKASRVAGLERVARALAGDEPALARGGGVAA